MPSHERPTDHHTQRIVSGFPATAGAAQVAAGIDLTGKRAIVTGASSGIGLETARTLAAAGAQVTLAVRRPDAGEAAVADIRAGAPGAQLAIARLDLADLDSVAAFARAWSGPLHLLIENAGIMALPTRRLTDRGVELQFATNHLGHFALAIGLHDALAAGPARIVVVSSIGHRSAPVDFDDIDFERRPYDPWTAYGQSKTANILFAIEANRRWSAAGITANALHPGGIDTGLDRHQGAAYRDRLSEQFGGVDRIPWRTPQQGAATGVYLATSPDLDGIGGRYFEDLAEAEPTDEPLSADGNHAPGVARYALDPAGAERLWTLSEQMLTRRRQMRA